MPLTWCELEGRVDVLNILACKLCVGAPVQTIESKDNAMFTQYNIQVEDERLFALQYTGRISDNYQESVEQMLTEIGYYLSAETIEKEEFWSEVIMIKLRRKRNNLQISLVVTRPCAYRYGIYKYVMCKLKEFVIVARLNKLELTCCLPVNEMILRKMGFEISKGKPGDCPDMYITKDKLISIYKNPRLAEKWDISSFKFPSADKLMSQQEVDRFNYQKKERVI